MAKKAKKTAPARKAAARKTTAARKTARKTTVARKTARKARPAVRVRGNALEISNLRVPFPDPRTAAICGAQCTCDGVGCGFNHPGAGLHCQNNPPCPAGCTGTCRLGANHAWILPNHACTHGHEF